MLCIRYDGEDREVKSVAIMSVLNSGDESLGGDGEGTIEEYGILGAEER